MEYEYSIATLALFAHSVWENLKGPWSTFVFVYMREFGCYVLFGACRSEGNHCETTKDNLTYFQEHN